MNRELCDLAAALDLDAPANEPLRMRFGLACVRRVAHLLEDARALAGLEQFGQYVAGEIVSIEGAAATLAQVARSHKGSGSIDGASHAAVSATYALANAMAGRSLQAASYCAYATVYAYGAYAISDPASFEPELRWQLCELERLARTSNRPAA